MAEKGRAAIRIMGKVTEIEKNVERMKSIKVKRLKAEIDQNGLAHNFYKKQYLFRYKLRQTINIPDARLLAHTSLAFFCDRPHIVHTKHRSVKPVQ